MSYIILRIIGMILLFWMCLHQLRMKVMMQRTAFVTNC